MDIGDCDPGMKHARSIIHLDVDCFYAQVEMVRHPEYRSKPLGIQQKNLVVTSNYAAREFGVKKCMPVDEALLLCPRLVLIRGEDLTNYRRASADIAEILHRYTPLVERSGLDESFIDVSSLVGRWTPEFIADSGPNDEDDEDDDDGGGGGGGGSEELGNIFGKTDEECPCGCHSRLRTAARIALEMRRRIFDQLGLTCSAGIGHNKLVAKLAGSLHKPKQQTLVYPWAAAALVSRLGSVGNIPGIGSKTLGSLRSEGIRSVEDLRKISLEDLESRIGGEAAKRLKDSAEGIDESVVKPSGRPQSIGVEDGCRDVSLVGEVESRLGALLRRLVELANEDGRIPVALRVTVRKRDFTRSGSSSKRETRQCALPRHLSPSNKPGIYDSAKILALAMKLFHRAVNVTKPFHLTLLGVAFTKFEECVSGRSSITSFLRKQVAVQSVLDISSEGEVLDDSGSLGSPMSVNQDSNDAVEFEALSAPRDLARTTAASSDRSPSNLGTETTPTGPSPCNATDEDDPSNEVEPSPKKTKLEVWLSGRRESPSNEMASLRLGPSSPISTQAGADSSVFKSLPIDLQREVSRSWQSGKTKPNNILKYFIANK